MRRDARSSRNCRAGSSWRPPCSSSPCSCSIPLGQLVDMSLTDRSLLGGGKFVGFDNYLRIWRDSSFWRALEFTVKYTLVLTPILMGLGFALALLTVRQHAAQAPHAHDRVPAGGHRPLEFEPAVVLAARRAGRPVQQAAGRPARDPRADRLVRHRRSRVLGGGDFDHLESRRLRHGAVRRRASSRSTPTFSRPR